MPATSATSAGPSSATRGPHPLLADWLDTEPDALAGVARALSVGRAANAQRLGQRATSAKVDELDSTLRLAGGGYDLVAAVDCVAPGAVAAQLSALARCVGPGGRLLLVVPVASADCPGVSVPELVALVAAGLQLVTFEDLSEDGWDEVDGRAGRDSRETRGPRDAHDPCATRPVVRAQAPRRWLRAVYARPPA